MITPWRCSTASCTLWADGTAATSARSSGTIPLYECVGGGGGDGGGAGGSCRGGARRQAVRCGGVRWWRQLLARRWRQPSSCSLERYDPATNAWEAAAPLTTPHDCYMPSPWRRFLCANFSRPCCVLNKAHAACHIADAACHPGPAERARTAFDRLSTWHRGTPSPTPDASALPFPDPVVAVRCWPPLIEHCPLTQESAACRVKAESYKTTTTKLQRRFPIHRTQTTEMCTGG